MLITTPNAYPNVTSAEILYNFDHVDLQGSYSANFTSQAEKSTSISCEKLAISLDAILRVTLKNTNDGTTIFDVSKDQIAVEPRKKSFTISNIDLPSAEVSFTVHFQRNISPTGEFLVCQIRRKRGSPLKISISLNNAALDFSSVSTFEKGKSQYSTSVTDNSFSISVKPAETVENPAAAAAAVVDDQPEEKQSSPSEKDVPEDKTEIVDCLENQNSSVDEPSEPAAAPSEPTAEPSEPAESSDDTKNSAEIVDQNTETPAEGGEQPGSHSAETKDLPTNSIPEELHDIEEPLKSEEPQETADTKETAETVESAAKSTEPAETPAIAETVETTKSAESSQQISGQTKIGENENEREENTTNIAEDGPPEDSEEYEEDSEYEEGSEEYEEESEEELSSSLKYTADQLLLYKDLDDCQKEPEHLANSNIPILKKNIGKQQNPRQNSGQKRRNQRPKNRKPNRKGGRNQNQGPQVHLTEIKPLEKSENRFKPSALNKVECSAAEETLKTVNRILNKLAAENLATLSTQLIASLIDDDEVLSGVVGLIYDKALEQPKFVRVYAELCNIIQRAKTVFGNTLVQKLADRAKTVFRTITKANIGTKADYTEEERNYLIKLRYLGNIEFICELYKFKLLAPTVPIYCAQQLLQQTNDFISEDDSLESLCKMLKSLGDLLQRNSSDAMSIIMGSLQARKSDKTLSSRIRFMIQDTIDLAKNSFRVPHPQGAPRGKPKSRGKSALSSSVNSLNTGGSYGQPRASPKVATTSSQGWKTQNQKKRGGSNAQQPRSSPQPQRRKAAAWGRNSVANLEDAKKTNARKYTPKSGPSTPETTSPPPEEEKKTVKLDDEAKEKFDNSVKNLLDEYYEIIDLEEAKACISDLNCTDNLYTEFVAATLRRGRKDTILPPTVKLLIFLYDAKILTSTHLENGYKLIFDSLEDDSEEFPNLPKFMGLMCGSLVEHGAIPLSFLTEINSLEDRMVILRFCGATLSRCFEKCEDESKIIEDLKAAKLTALDLVRKQAPERLARYYTNEVVIKAILSEEFSSHS
eukprot:CAMPEP_0117035740 /NCGR_PEP_ID=MMETSP0472-20121206/25367_1 /TAXON_ID=693140 ORGANISM="Tiarina fusus, Strain LIS" /NCGR_SAMPLE_ID=MMETSP0472 /ASSEMBLY_ACC=CAM_ASM_000603 /LENGTH=1039 /DNA_ID=CAMNT_0004745305 /DNA_START=30 /DNA_END=3149 /DNA_ORIENTATION=-